MSAIEKIENYSPKVVVIEDEQEVADIIVFNLKKYGLEVYHALTGLEGCSLISLHNPEAVVLDLMLPDLDGCEICRLIRSHDDPWAASTPVIMLTALGMPFEREVGLEAGADDYMSKPFSVRELSLRVKKLLEKRRDMYEAQSRIKTSEEKRNQTALREQTLLHEVKNKLFTVGGYSKRLELHANDLSPSEVRQYAKEIARSSEYLSSLSDKLMELGKVASMALGKTPQISNVNEIVKKVVGLHSAEASARGIKIDVKLLSEEQRVICSPQLLELAISNLAENVIKHCPIMTTATISAEVEKGWGIIKVSDDGPGLSEDAVTLTMTAYETLKPYSCSNNSSGIGVAIARKTMEDSAGIFLMDTKAGQGTTFTLKLPLAD
ncbi:MAG: hypothetical protein C0608_10545 [Deltaproteobacteria bacterium]|nr:MAG: hypothetical protein C0608_10545 [Deltaproteobacteria bacterium]